VDAQVTFHGAGVGQAIAEVAAYAA
jgi:hypothetical protein